MAADVNNDGLVIVAANVNNDGMVIAAADVNMMEWSIKSLGMMVMVTRFWRCQLI